MEDRPTDAPTPGPEADAVTPSPDLVLRPGSKIQLGWRKGLVEEVRGGWVRPYEVRLRWEGEKVPLYLVFATLERDFRAGRLRVLQGEGART